MNAALAPTAAGLGPFAATGLGFLSCSPSHLETTILYRFTFFAALFSLPRLGPGGIR